MTATQPHPYDNPQGRQQFLTAELLSMGAFFTLLGGIIAALGGAPGIACGALLVTGGLTYLARRLRRHAWDLTPGAAGRRSWDAPLNPARLIRPTTNSLLLGFVGFWLMSNHPDSGPLYAALAMFTGVVIGLELAYLVPQVVTRSTLDWPTLLITMSTPLLVLTFVLLTEPSTTQGWALSYAILGLFSAMILRTLADTL